MNKKIFSLVSSFLIFFVLFFSFSIYSKAASFKQMLETRFCGTVTDNQRAILPGATITMRNLSTGIEHTATSDQDGNYCVNNITFGNYKIFARKQGFRTISRTVTIQPASSARGDFSLDPGEGIIDEDNIGEGIIDEGNIELLVKTKDGENIPTARMTITDADNKKEEITPDECGRYKIEELEAGSYRITIEAQGYKTKRERIRVRRGETSLKIIRLKKLP